MTELANIPDTQLAKCLLIQGRFTGGKKGAKELLGESLYAASLWLAGQINHVRNGQKPFVLIYLEQGFFMSLFALWGERGIHSIRQTGREICLIVYGLECALKRQ